MKSYRRLSNRQRSNSSTSKAVVAVDTSSAGKTNGNTQSAHKTARKRKNSKSTADDIQELSSPKSLKV